MARFVLKKRTVRIGAKLFLFCSVLGLLGVYFFNERSTGFLSLHSIRYQFAIFIVLLTAVDYALGAGRIWFTALSAGKRIRFIDGIKADLSNTFFSSVTPMQTGGGPAQLYILTKAGLRLGEAMAVSFMNFIFSVIFIYCAAGFVIFSGAGEIKAALFLNLFRFAYAFVAFLLVLGILNMRWPGVAFWFIGIFKKGAHLFFPGHAERIEGLFSAFIEHLGVWWKNFVFLLRYKKFYLAGGLGITVILFLNKYTLAYFVIRSLGVDPAYTDVISAMLLLNALLYFSPSPGASGIAEIGAASLVGGLLPAGYAMAFTFVWRFFSSYLGVSLGAVFLYRAISHSLESAFVSEREVVTEPVES